MTKLLARCASLCCASCALSSDSPRAPNIIFILADDLGYNEMGFMNSTRGIRTPNLDAMAAAGVVLKNYYVQPICSPTRSALMTGRVPTHLGTQANVIYWDTPWAIDAGETFLAQNLKDAGYTTGIFGKWHLGMFRQSATPRARGFDEHAGYLQGCVSKETHVASCCHAGPSPATGDKNYTCASGGNKDYRGYDWFSSGASGGFSMPDTSVNRTSSASIICNAAIDFIRRHAAEAAPFFLYLPFQNIHAPYSVEERYRDPYEGQAITDDEKTMWAYISEMDEKVGIVISALKAIPGAYEQTVIIFSSDNGAPRASPGVDHDEATEQKGRAWIARNYPFSGFKSQIWEGGVRVASFVHSPHLIQPGVHHGLFHVTDWLPTLVHLANGSTARNRPLDGYNIWGAVTTGHSSPRAEMLYNVNPLCHGGQAGAPKAGLRMGDWKLLTWCYDVAGTAGANRTGPVNAPHGSVPVDFIKGPMLFNLQDDPREMHNLAAEQPALVATLLTRLEKWASSSVEPMQWVRPYQGDAYFCKDCPLHPAGTGVAEPWLPWIDDSTFVV